MAQRRPPGLRRVVGSSTIAGTVFGNIASSLFLVLGVATGYALGFTPIVFIVAGIVFLLTAQSFLEGMTMLPQAGGSSSFARRAFNDLWSFVAGWAVLLDYLIIVTIAAFFASHYLSVLPGLERFDQQPYSTIVSAALIGIVALVNLRGTITHRTLTVFVSVVAVVALGLLAVLGLFTVTDFSDIGHNFDSAYAPSWHMLAFALPIAMMGFTGVENAANLSEELRERADSLRIPLFLSIGVAILLLAGLSVVGLASHPVRSVDGHNITRLAQTSGEHGYQAKPIAGIVDHINIHGVFLDIVSISMALLALAVLFLLANTGIAGMARLTYAMSRNRQVPSVLGNIERDAGTPALAVILFTLLSMALLLVTTALHSSAIALAELYAFGAMIGCMIAHASIIRLRFTEPELERPYRAPLNVKIRGVIVPVSSVLGFIACALIWGAVVATHPATRVVGVIWLMAGFVCYAMYRFLHGLPLLKRADWRVQRTVAIEAPIYRKALVAVRPPSPGLLESQETEAVWSELALDEELTAMAAKMLDIEDGEIAALAVHEIPLKLALNVDLGRSDEVTAQRLGAIRTACNRLGTRLSTTVARSRGAGRAICQEAARRECDVIVMAAPNKRRPGDPLFGRTVEYVLRHAECDVAVLRFPDSVGPQQGRVDES